MNCTICDGRNGAIAHNIFSNNIQVAQICDVCNNQFIYDHVLNNGSWNKRPCSISIEQYNNDIQNIKNKINELIVQLNQLNDAIGDNDINNI